VLSGIVPCELLQFGEALSHPVQAPPFAFGPVFANGATLLLQDCGREGVERELPPVGCELDASALATPIFGEELPADAANGGCGGGSRRFIYHTLCLSWFSDR
jgi:hypothetical protein